MHAPLGTSGNVFSIHHPVSRIHHESIEQIVKALMSPVANVSQSRSEEKSKKILEFFLQNTNAR